MSALPRRPFLGLRVRTVDGGLYVTEVVRGATAAASGVLVDDVLEQVNGRPVADTTALTEAMRASGDCVLEVRRGGALHRLGVSSVDFPLEQHPEADVTLSEVHLTVGGNDVRWRTLISTPHATASWAVVFLGGIRVDSLEHHGLPNPLSHVLTQLARVAVTVRVERGVGDSEGPGPDGIDFESEHQAYRAAIESQRQQGRSVMLLGHSVGGMHAPRLPADARVVYGTSAERWSSCLAQSTRRQLLLRDPSAATEGAEERARRFDTAALRERPRTFHEQLEALDLRGEWRACREPTLVMHGEYDWVVGHEEAASIAAHAPNATLLDIAQTDHAFGQHASLQASLRDYGRGRPSDTVVSHIRGLLQS